MANKIQIKRGSKANLPALSDGELAFCKDAGELYVGNSGANQQVGALVQSGTWTPTIQCAVSYTVRNGFYFKVGRHVTLCCQLTFAMDGANDFIITGLPFAASYSAGTVPTEITAGIFLAPMVHLQLAAGSGSVQLMSDYNNGSLSSIETNAHDNCENRTATCTINFTLDYIVNS